MARRVYQLVASLEGDGDAMTRQELVKAHHGDYKVAPPTTPSPRKCA